MELIPNSPELPLGSQINKARIKKLTSYQLPSTSSQAVEHVSTTIFFKATQLFKS